MKSPFIGNLSPNSVVTTQFLVLSKEIRQKKTGEPYLALHLADRTGQIEAKMWDNVPEIMDTFDRDDFVKVKGLLQVYQNRSQFTIHRLRRLEDHEVDLADYFPCSERDPDEMFGELRTIVANIGNVHLRSLLETVFEDPLIAGKYKMAPAAKNIHHACRGGLLEHVLSLCALARLTASHYKNVDGDLLVTGAILHDIGKLEELSYSRSFGYSAEGQLLGHIVIGLRIVGNKLDRLPAFPPKLRTLIEHMIISHHGELEFGSPKVPAFAEALLLHHIDNLDSKMDALRGSLKRDHADSEFTGWVSALDRILLRKERFLQDEEPTPKQAEEKQPEQTPAANVEQTAAREQPQPVAPAPAPAAKPPVPGPPSPGLPSSGSPLAETRTHVHEQKPAPMTLFGEKLQAVLESRK